MGLNSVDRMSLQIVFFGLGGGAYLIYNGFKKLSKHRKAQDTATSRISSAPQGFVEIQGYAWPKETFLHKNLDGRKCVYLSTVIQKRVKQGKNSTWITIADSFQDQPFYVLDTTGALHLDPNLFELDIQTKRVPWSQIQRPMRSDLLSRLRPLGNELPPLDPGFFSAQYRCVERSILLGSPLFIHGNLQTPQNTQNEVSDPKMKVFFDSLLKFKNDQRRKFALMDHNRDGKIDLKESHNGFYASAEIAHRQTTPPESQVPFFGFLSINDQHPSFIYDGHQEHFLRKLSTLGTLMMLGGLVSVLVGTYLLIKKLHLNI